MKQRWRRWMRWTGGLLLTVLLALTVFFVWAWYRARQVPDFYAAALLVPPEALAESGEELEEEIQQLSSDLHREGRWEVVITEEEINGWLAVQLPTRYPHLLPEQLRRPRVDIDPDRMRLAASYEGKRLRSIVSLTVTVAAVEGDTHLQVTLLQARLGKLTVPTESIKKYIDRAADAMQLELEWSQDEDDHPVAMLAVPLPSSVRDMDIRIDRIVIQPEQVVVYGRSRRADSFLDWLNDNAHSPSASR